MLQGMLGNGGFHQKVKVMNSPASSFQPNAFLAEAVYGKNLVRCLFIVTKVVFHTSEDKGDPDGARGITRIVKPLLP